MEYSFEQLNQQYETLTAHVDVEATTVTDLVGGQPGGAPGVTAFVKHHLGLEGDEAEAAVRRILNEEVGEHDVTPEGGELKEKKVYGINVLRHGSRGVYLGDWMAKAMIKQAASRVGLFQEQRGSKGNFAEAGRVTAIGISLQDPAHPNHIYLRNPAGDGPAETVFKEFTGRVQTPQGAVSIMHHSEVAAPGTRFAFRFHFLPGKVKEADLVDIFAMTMVCGLGSVRSLECGKFKINRLAVEIPKPKVKEKDASKPRSHSAIDAAPVDGLQGEVPAQ
jgi:hypothetical protein